MGWTIQGTNPSRDNKVPLLENAQTRSEVHPASYAMRLGVIPRNLSDPRLVLTIHFNLPLKSRMSGFIPLLHQFVFVAFTEITLLLFCKF
jgi:hypothetical protein